MLMPDLSAAKQEAPGREVRRGVLPETLLPPVTGATITSGGSRRTIHWQMASFRRGHEKTGAAVMPSRSNYACDMCYDVGRVEKTSKIIDSMSARFRGNFSVVQSDESALNHTHNVENVRDRKVLDIAWDVGYSL